MTEDDAFAARRLIRAARAATLATAQEGQPFASLVTPATAPDGSILLWLSSLSEHTRQLRRDGRCALLFTGVAEGANPQTAPRVTVTGVAEAVEDAALKARWLACHPYAALYADFADFGLWRVRPGGALLVGGFARARRFSAAELAPPAADSVQAAESDIIGHVNADHADAVLAIATALGGEAGAWRLVAVDADGCDLACGEKPTLRLAFRAPATTPGAVREELVHAARVARVKHG